MTALFVCVCATVLGLSGALRGWAAARRGRAAVALDRLVGGGARAGAAVPRSAVAALPFPLSYMNRRLAAGGLVVSVQTVLLLLIAGGAACWAAAALLAGPGILADLAAAGGIWVPLAWVDRLASRRREAIAAEMERLAAALEAGVTAGMVSYEALLEVGLGAGGVLGAELLRTVEDADRIGLSEALLLFGQRLPLPEVRLLVAALRLNQGAGAGLAASLEGLRRTLRERREAAAALRAATAAGRYQASMLVAVPPLLLLLMRVLYPAFEAPLFATASGRVLLAGTALWVLIGSAVVRRMCVPQEVL
jgi:tight adherence protein B